MNEKEKIHKYRQQRERTMRQVYYHYYYHHVVYNELLRIVYRIFLYMDQLIHPNCNYTYCTHQNMKYIQMGKWQDVLVDWMTMRRQKTEIKGKEKEKLIRIYKYMCTIKNNQFTKRIHRYRLQNELTMRQVYSHYYYHRIRHCKEQDNTCRYSLHNA